MSQKILKVKLSIDGTEAVMFTDCIEGKSDIENVDNFISVFNEKILAGDKMLLMMDPEKNTPLAFVPNKIKQYRILESAILSMEDSAADKADDSKPE
jgi:hypothetical protein